MCSKYSELFRILDDAFVRGYPGDDYIAVVRNDYPRYEGNVLLEYFKGKSWRSLLDDDFLVIKKIFGKNINFAFFKAIGFAYYVPAFLLYFCLEKDEENMQMFFYNFMPGNSQLSMDRFGEIFNVFNDNELVAIKKSLDVLDKIWSDWGCKDNAASRALNEYWSYI